MMRVFLRSLGLFQSNNDSIWFNTQHWGKLDVESEALTQIKFRALAKFFYGSIPKLVEVKRSQ